MKTPRTSLEVMLTALAALIDGFDAATDQLRDGDEAAVHDLRTAIRRLRSILSSAGSILDADSVELILDELREAGEWLEPARTAQVHRETAQQLLYDASRSDYPDDLREHLVREALREEAVSRSSAVEQLDSDAFHSLRRDLDDLTARPSLGKNFADDPDVRVPIILAKQAKRAKKRLRPPQTHDLPALHSARKSARRFRYLVDELSDETKLAGSKDWVRASGAATKFQDAVGDHRDTTLFLDYLAEQAAAAARAGEDVSFYRELEQFERKQQEEQFDTIQKRASKLRKALGRVV